jgi:peroxiredoxin
MKKTQLSLFLALILIVADMAPLFTVSATPDVPAAPAIGATIDDFTVSDVDGKDRTLNSLKGKNGTVLIFIAVQCPVSNAYNARMAKLAADYSAKGINVVGINSNVAETADAVKSHAAANNLSFTVVKDTGNKIADRLGATVTPEAYLLDANNKLLYHGRIDNSRNDTAVTSSELRDAIDASLAGKSVEKTSANAFGCSIKRA